MNHLKTNVKHGFNFKLVGLVLLITAVLMGSIGCGSTKLADSFDASAVEAKAKEVIEVLNTGNYQQVSAMVKEEYQSDLSPEVIESAVKQVYGDAGAFTEFVSVSVVGRKVQDQDMAIALVQAKYGSKKVTFTLVFDQQLALNGFYIK